jgi:hypothetical protein
MVFLQRDLVIILANGVSLCLLLGILYFKLREHRQGSRSSDCCSSPGVTKVVGLQGVRWPLSFLLPAPFSALNYLPPLLLR